jgi:inner membrane protein YidH
MQRGFSSTVPLGIYGRARNHFAEESSMETPAVHKPAAELRDYLAEERTFLAWIRTGLTLMGFGFVVARFGLFLEVMQLTRGAAEHQSHLFSRWVGTAFVVTGVAVNLLSMRRHVRLVTQLNQGQLVAQPASKLAVVLAVFLALIGVAIALYVSLT